jgi:SM-20-related protein
LSLALSAQTYENSLAQTLYMDAISAAPVFAKPYPHLAVSSTLPFHRARQLDRDFPPLDRTGFFPLKELWRRGAFARLINDLESPELAEILTQKLDIELRDKPRLITIRKWSAAKDGRIHNDSPSKIATALLYLNRHWPKGDAGWLRVLRSATDFNESETEISPVYGSFFAFRRTENSWHGHKSYVGERRVVQITWLRSWDDYHRKQRRARLSWFLKGLS